MITLPRRISEWVADHNASWLLAGLVTFSAPTLFVRSLLGNNRARKNAWHPRKACLTFSFDCDYPEDVQALPQVVETFSRYGFKASFACVGYWIEQYPSQHRLLLDAGHEIVNHTYSHPDNELLNPGVRFKELPQDKKAEEVARCHRVCQETLGYSPAGCRIPHFKNLFSPDIYGILKELGYTYSSSTWLTNTRSFGMPFTDESGILEFPLTTCPKHPFSVFDTWHSFNSPKLLYRLGHRSEEAYVSLFKILIDCALETQSYINIYIDPKDTLFMKRLHELLDYCKEREPLLWVARYEDIVGTMKPVS